MMIAEELQCSKSNFSPEKSLEGLFLFPSPWTRAVGVIRKQKPWAVAAREGSGTLSRDQMCLVAASPGAVGDQRDWSCDVVWDYLKTEAGQN